MTPQWKQIKNAVRSKYAWPGGYPLFLIMSDGEALSIDSARDNWRLLVQAQLDNDRRGGWFAVAAEVNWEAAELYCAHSGERIESAYAEPEE